MHDICIYMSNMDNQSYTCLGLILVESENLILLDTYGLILL